MRILRWYHHRIVGFGLCWLMLAYENCWFFLIFTGGESAHEKYHWGRQETADSRGGSSSVFVSTWEGYGSPGPIMERTAIFQGYHWTVYGIRGDSSWDAMGDMLHCLSTMFLGYLFRHCFAIFVPNFWYDIWVWYQTMLGRPLFRTSCSLSLCHYLGHFQTHPLNGNSWVFSLDMMIWIPVKNQPDRKHDNWSGLQALTPPKCRFHQHT